MERGTRDRNLITDYEEAKRLLYNIFSEMGINGESKWEKCLLELNNDDRFRLVKSLKDCKKIFQSYVSDKRSEDRFQLNNNKKIQKDNFKTMLDEYKLITIDTRYTSLLPIFYLDPRWICLDDKEREECFLDYMDNLFRRQAEDEQLQNKTMCDRLKIQFLEIKKINSLTSWEDIKEIMRYNNLWTELHDYYKLK